MAASEPDRWRETIRAHMHDTVAYILAQSGKCLDLQAWETEALKPRSSKQRTGRNVVPLLPGELGKAKPSASWIMAVLLCPGDDSKEVALWARRHRLQTTDRIRFFGIGTINLKEAFAPWYDAGFGDPDFIHVTGKPERLNHFFGQFLNDQTAKDFML